MEANYLLQAETCCRWWWTRSLKGSWSLSLWYGNTWKTSYCMSLTSIASAICSYKPMSEESCKILFWKRRKKCEKHVNEIIQMEKLVDFARNPLYMKTYCNLLTSKVQFIERLRNLMRDAENMSCGTEYAYSVPWIQIMLMMVHCIIYWWYTMYMYLTLQASTNGESVSTVVQRHGQVRST